MLARKSSWIVLSAIVFLAIGVRVYGLGHGLPDVFYNDEEHHIYWALNMGGGDLNPHQFYHPTLFFYLLFAVDSLFALIGLLSGLFHSPADIWVLYRNDHTLFFVLGRTLSLVFGVLNVLLMYFFGKLIRCRKTGLAAAFFLSLSYLHAQYSQIAYLDVGVTFLMTASAYAAVRAYRCGRFRDFFIVGFVAGLVFSMKYSGIILLFLGPLVLLLRGYSNRPKAILTVLYHRNLGVFFLAFIAAFTLGTPYWILDFKTFAAHFLDFFNFYKPQGTGQLGYEGSWNWFYYLKQPLRYGMGALLEWGGIVSIGWLLLRRRLLDYVWLALPLIYFMAIGQSDIRTARYALPLIPFLCLACAVSAAEFTDRYLQSWSGVRRLSLFFILCSVLVIQPSISLLHYHALNRQEDTRTLLKNWALKNIPSNAMILGSQYDFLSNEFYPHRDNLDGPLFDTRLNHVSTLKPLAKYRQQGYRYLILDDWHVETALNAARYNPARAEVTVRYQQLQRELEETGVLLAQFSPYKKDTKTFFEAENVEFLSIGLGYRDRPGPLIRVYQL